MWLLPLDVVLEQRGEVADRHAEQCAEPDHGFPCRAAGFERGHEEGEGGCLRRGGHEGCDGCGDFRLTDVAGRLVKDLLA